MKHFSFLLLVFLLLFTGALLEPSSVFAENKCGVNIGPNYSQVDQVLGMTKQGGWVVALGTPGNCSGFEDLFGKGLNVVIRAYNGGRTFTKEEALGWVATLGNLDTKGQVVYFMPWNEPNHDNEGGGSTAGNYVYEYSQTLKTALQDAGLLGTKVILLSPMVDKLNPSFVNGSFFNNPGGKSGFYNLFQGSSINEYDQFSPGPCSAGDPQNNCRYDQLGIPPAFYALEAGVVADGCSPPCYKDDQIKQMLDTSWEKWKTDGNFKMFAIFSYDPHRSDWNIFSSSQTQTFYQNACTISSVNSGSFDANKFNSWFSSHKDQLVQCGETCGYAPSLSYCAATAFTPGEEGTGVPPARSGLDSRPFECKSCNTTDKLIGSCATSFTINDQISYKKKEGNSCVLQDPGWWVERPWGGTIGIDPSSTTIPFVGKKGSESEQKYLADYFEGTDKYYYFYQDPIQQLSHAGVWRKLAPKQTQDKLKREMVLRSCGAQDTGIHDYQVISETGDTAFLSEIKDHTPPLETQTNYWEAYDDWANSNGGKWARLWAAVPMFSHEDTPGQIIPYVATKIHDNVTYPLPSQEIEKVPHVARLYEATKAVSELLKPSKEESSQSMNNNTALLAAAEKYQPEEKVLLAQAQGSCFHLGAEASAYSQGGFASVNVTVKVYSDGGDGHIQLFIDGASKGTNWGWNKGRNNPFVIVHQYTGSPINIPYGGSVSRTYAVKIDECGDRGNYADISCNFSVDSAGNFSTNCGAAQPPPPSCGLPGASPVDACNKEALRDTNPNDTLCCSLMKINLSAVEQVLNKDHATCITVNSCGCEYIDVNHDNQTDESERFCCQPDGCDYSQPQHPEGICVKQPSSACEDVVQVPVNRQVGITLSHPYLSEIWDYTGKDEVGVFNIFRPETNDKFKELDAASSIQYSYSPGTVSPATGSFYFPYLGGIQKTKEWVARTLLPSKQ